jgi:aminoglycoside phosphotransferase (APT) family kinase protein
MPAQADIAPNLSAFLKRYHDAKSVDIQNLRRLTGGASKQTWAFDAKIEDGAGVRTVPLVMRSDPRRLQPGGEDLEYHLLKAAGDSGVPVPHVYARGDGSLNMPFFLMDYVEGETIPRRLLRDDEYAEARATLPGQLADVLAKIHAIPIEAHGLDALPSPADGVPPAAHEVERYEQIYRAVTPEPHPTFELAFRWLRDQLPDGARTGLVHGDFRMGNFMCGPEGLRAVLDWELAHVGDPMEDIGWACVRSWRFGSDDKPVAGLGLREEFYHAYEKASGRPIDAHAVRFWEAFGNLRWGITCIVQAKTYLDGHSKSVELASIGRRIAETEWELLKLMEAA